MVQSGSSKIILNIKGMSCSSCELKIENVLGKVDGVKQVKVSLAESSATIEYDSSRVTPDQLAGIIQKLGYEIDPGDEEKTKSFTVNQFLGIGIVIFAIYFMIKSTVGFNFIPRVDQSFGFGMLFVVGLLTSLHCIAMCGGINLSQCVNQPDEARVSKLAGLKPSLMYNTGRVISYTVVGGLAGALGSVVTFSGVAKGIVSIVAGVFMVVIGIKMLDVFPWLRRFNISSPKFLGKKISNNRSKLGPFYVGLLNGLMPCGPLQTMQIYALGTGSPLAGAASMFFFSLGTVPLMFGFGAISSFLSSKFNHRMLKISAVLVIVLGLTMVSRGLSLSGISVAAPLSGNTGSVAKIEGDVQVVTSRLDSGRYYPIVVQKGKPVRWIIQAQAEDLNGCNNPLTIPSYGITKELKPGENVIEFTPDQEGKITYTCWMGMISSYIKVVPDLNKVSDKELKETPDPGYGGGGCCAAGAQATRFAGGRIPTDDITVARIIDGKQEVTIMVNDQGYAPAAVILQRGVKTVISFNLQRLNSCNYLVQFPEYRGQLDLSKGQTATPEIEVTQDFTFQCWMGMLHGYVKVVDDINNIDLDSIKEEIQAYKPSGGGGGCCGG
jgi:sulfite exporter TauE/SafE/plastocyanin domain-containing protein/copper chaperone CopZ